VDFSFFVQGLTPQENRASDHIIAALKPYTKENGGPLEVSHGSSPIMSGVTSTSFWFAHEEG
jgi:hypothetical protein